MVNPIKFHYLRLQRPIMKREERARAHVEAKEARALERKRVRAETNYADAMEMLKLIEQHPSRSSVKRLVDMRDSHPDKRIVAKAASILLRWAGNPSPRKKRSNKEKW